MKWYQIKDKKPETGVDVLTCYNPNNEFSCEVRSLEYYDDGTPYWWGLHDNMQVDDTDYWAYIEMPILHKEDE